MEPQTRAPRAAGRRFLRFALISLLPVLVLGLVLAASYRDEAQRRGLAAGVGSARLLARAAVEPLLGDDPVGNGLDDDERRALQRLTYSTINRGDVLRLRLRSLTGRVVYSPKPADIGIQGHPLAGDEMVAKLTHLGADQGLGPRGPAAVEVYLPLLGSAGAPIGVLEVYLPYAPIDADMAAGLHRLYVILSAGLVLLWAALFVIAASVSRRLRHQVAANAYLAEHDVLTGLPNRSMFHGRAARALAGGREGSPVALAMVDLDRFKEVNDTLGHQHGDEVLTELAGRLAAALAPGDTVARFGGDEFGIVLADGRNAATTLQRLRDIIGAELQVDHLPLSIEASIGYVLAPDDGNDVDTLLQRADVAMYVAKRQHAGVLRYDRQDDHYDATTLGLIGELRSAIGAGQMVLHYQPKAAIDCGEVEAVEALVRWQHPEQGLLGPARFLPFVEQTDLIHDLTAWVLRQALTDIGPTGIGVAVNVSARDLGRRDFASRVRALLGEVDVAPGRLTLEITETAILADPGRAAETLAELAALGVQVSIDDFGQGHTSLRYLSVLPVHELKVDRAFVAGMLHNPAHAAIVRSIVDLGHNLGMRVVAEGVEHDAELDALRDLTCDVAQGYLLARPMSIAALPAWLASSAVV